ncbi:MAG: hypothetical protein IJ039_03625 [Clostridia bacterium]|nr:hypothetical protein [Clostridia bacterium]
MSITNELDHAIKLSEAKTGSGGYIVGGRVKSTYMTREEWESFKGSMSPQALKEYGEGGGDELSEKNGCPPKMASYGSSSRMIYMLSRDKEGFHYEKKLATTVGGKANLDGFYEDENRYVFVEAKCHEPYTAKKNVVSMRYRGLYEYINEHMAEGLLIKMEKSTKDNYMNVEYFVGDEPLERFDIKQMICHLLGIATGILRGELEPKQIDFIYLLYDPTQLRLVGKVKETVNAIYTRTCYECDLVDFEALLQVIVAYLKKTKYGNAPDKNYKFTFSRQTQKNYLA